MNFSIGKIAICITTFERPKACRKAIETALHYYPGAHIYVADDSKTPVDFKGATTYKLPFDQGISYKRNLLINNTTEPYIFIMDDDEVFTQNQAIQNMWDVVTHTEAQMCGCKLNEYGKYLFYHGNMDIKANVLHYIGHDQKTFRKTGNGTQWARVEIIPNIFLAERSVFKTVQWDSRKKVGEHTDFFLQAKRQGIYVAYTPNAELSHRKMGYSTVYRQHRNRGRKWKAQTGKEWGYSSFVHFNGKTVNLINKKQA